MYTDRVLVYMDNEQMYTRREMVKGESVHVRREDGTY